MIVVDSSIALKWYIPEAENELARNLLILHTQGKDILTAPILILFEISNALSTKPHVTSLQAQKIIENLYKIDLRVINFTLSDFKIVIDLSKKFGISAYDASYIALAKRLRCAFVTADKKLYQQVGKKLKFIRLLS